MRSGARSDRCCCKRFRIMKSWSSGMVAPTIRQLWSPSSTILVCAGTIYRRTMAPNGPQTTSPTRTLLGTGLPILATMTSGIRPISKQFCELHKSTSAEIVSSVMIEFGPPGSGIRGVAGVFPTGNFSSRDFVPPSAFAHKMSIGKIVKWRDP